MSFHLSSGLLSPAGCFSHASQIIPASGSGRFNGLSASQMTSAEGQDQVEHRTALHFVILGCFIVIPELNQTINYKESPTIIENAYICLPEKMRRCC